MLACRGQGWIISSISSLIWHTSKLRNFYQRWLRHNGLYLLHQKDTELMVHPKRPSQSHRRGETKGFLAAFNTLQGLGTPMQQTATVRSLAVSKARCAYRDALGLGQTPWREQSPAQPRKWEGRWFRDSLGILRHFSSLLRMAISFSFAQKMKNYDWGNKLKTFLSG